MIQSITFRFLITIALGGVGGFVGKKLKIPLGVLLGAMFCVAVINCTVVDTVQTIPESPGQVPETEYGESIIYFIPQVRTALQLCTGIMIGTRIHRKNVKTLVSIILPFLLQFVLLIALNIGIGIAMGASTDLNAATALFAIVPGGASDMAIISADMGADPGIVGILQVCRLIFLLATIPPIIRRIARKELEREEKNRHDGGMDVDVDASNIEPSSSTNDVYTENDLERGMGLNTISKIQDQELNPPPYSGGGNEFLDIETGDHDNDTPPKESNLGHSGLLEMVREGPTPQFSSPLLSPDQNVPKQESIGTFGTFMERIRSSVWLSFALTGTVAICGGMSLYFTPAPAGAIIGSVISVTLVSIFFGPFRTPKYLVFCIQCFSGTYMGSTIGREIIIMVPDLWASLLYMILAVILMTFVIAGAVHLIFGVKWSDALMCTAPGGLTEMTIMCEQLNGDMPRVAATQTLRLVFVILTFPSMLSLMVAGEGN